MLGAVLMTLVLAEGALRILGGINGELDALLSIPLPPVVADDALGWRGNPGYPAHDAAGFRNRAVLSQASIVTLGDSQTYGHKVTPERAWPHQLEGLLRQPAYNMAFPGWGPPHSLLLLDDALALQPRALIQGFYTGNDLVDAFALVYGRVSLPDLRTTDRAVLEALAAAEQSDPWARNSDIQSILPQSEWATPSGLELVGRNFRLAGLGYAVGRAATSTLGLDEEPATEQVPFRTEQLRTIFDPSRRLVALNLADPRVSEGLRLSLDVFSRLDQRARREHARFVVLLIPTKELAFEEAVELAGGLDAPSYSRLVAEEEAVLQAVRAHLVQRDIEVIDALPSLRALIAAGRNPYFESNNGHPNALGHRAIAEAVEDHFR